MFVYSKKWINNHECLGPSDHAPRTVSQIDIVPTLSLLLGVPIPYGSLGSVIPELFLRSELKVADTSIGAVNLDEPQVWNVGNQSLSAMKRLSIYYSMYCL